MATVPLIAMLIKVAAAAAALFGLGIRAVGTGHRRPARHGLWVGPVLFLAAPAAAARLSNLSPMDAVIPICFSIGFVVAVTVTARRRPTHPSVHPTPFCPPHPGDDPS